MSTFILSALFGAVCAVIMLSGADAVDWTRFKFWVGTVWTAATEKAKKLLRRP
jgi:hypothetical protein